MLIVKDFLVLFLVVNIYELPSQEPGLGLSYIDNRITFYTYLFMYKKMYVNTKIYKHGHRQYSLWYCAKCI